MTRRHFVCSWLASMMVIVAQPTTSASPDDAHRSQAAQTASGATTDQLAADLKDDWASQKKRLMELADAMPPEKYTFKATEAQRTFGEQLVHLAEAHVKMLQALDASGSVPVPTLSHEPTKPEVLESLGAAYDYGTAVLDAAGGTLLEANGDSTRARAFWRAMSNGQNHYGQCVVYLRLNDIVPPASRR
ncbi:MAG: DinB family protein [Vicinamibacteraceae bacterium]